MRWKTTLAACALLGAMVPLAHAGSYSGCRPAQMAHEAMVSVNGQTFYVISYDQGTMHYEEVWQETNNIPGLQMSAAQACGASPDTYLHGVCYIRCPLAL